jgi:energy-coupling factor transporter transmembrane protein EcfT
MQSRGFTGEIFLLDNFKMQARDWWALVAFSAFTACALWMGH